MLKKHVIITLVLLGSVSLTGFAEDIELSYDDGDPRDEVSTALDSTIYAVRFSPPSGEWIIKTARYYVTTTGFIRVRLFDSYNDEPGPQLFPGVDANISPVPVGHWYEENLLSYDIHVDDDFFLGFEMPSMSNAPYIGMDHEENDRCWVYTPANNWYERDQFIFFMRVVITDQAGVEYELTPDPSIILNCSPDPFNTSTTISYFLPSPGKVSISIRDASGRQVNTLVDGYQSPGSHSIQWDGTDNKNNRLSSGVYFVKLLTDQGSINQRVVIID